MAVQGFGSCCDLLKRTIGHTPSTATEVATIKPPNRRRRRRGGEQEHRLQPVADEHGQDGCAVAPGRLTAHDHGS